MMPVGVDSGGHVRLLLYNVLEVVEPVVSSLYARNLSPAINAVICCCDDRALHQHVVWLASLFRLRLQHSAALLLTYQGLQLYIARWTGLSHGLQHFNNSSKGLA